MLGRLRVRHLGLVDVVGAPVPLRALVAASPRGLASLQLAGTQVTDAALADLVSAPQARALAALDLSRTAVTAAGLDVLARNGACAALTRLTLDGLHAGDDQATRMIEALEGWPALTELSCADNGCGVNVARALSRSPLTHRLTRLDLSHNQLGDDGAEALAKGAWHVLRELRADQNDIGAGGFASLVAAPAMPLLWRLHATHNVMAGGAVDIHMLSAQVVARIEASFAALSAAGADFAARFYEMFFARHPGVAPLFRRTSMQRQHQHLMAVLAFLVDNLRHPDTVASALGDLANRHVGYGVSPSHYYALSSVLLDAIRETLGEAFTPEVEAAWHEGLTAVITVMLGAHRAHRPKQESGHPTAPSPLTPSGGSAARHAP